MPNLNLLIRDSRGSHNKTLINFEANKATPELKNFVYKWETLESPEFPKRLNQMINVKEQLVTWLCNLRLADDATIK